MKSLFVLLLTVAQLGSYSIARADDTTGESDALQAAINFRDQFVTALQNKDFTTMTHDSMGDAIALLAQDIRDTYADEDMAVSLETIWKQNEGLFFTAQFNDLGDHAPLIPKLEEYFKTLSSKYGAAIMSLPLVSDIRTLNFAIPVVFHPRGDWQSPNYDNRIEYRLHFIPFANIVTYYGVLIGCDLIAAKEQQPDLKKICKPAAEKLKFVMGRYIAPQISDWIFAQTNKQITVSDSDLRYNTPDQLANAIKKTGNN